MFFVASVVSSKTKSKICFWVDVINSDFFYIFRVSTDMTRQFCGHCGNDTLQRVSVTVDADGSLKYFISTRKPISTRNKRVHFVGLVC